MSNAMWIRMIGLAYAAIIMFGVLNSAWVLVIGLGFFGLMFALANIAAEVAALRKALQEWEKR